MRYLAQFQKLYYLIYLNSNIRASFRETDNKASKYMAGKKMQNHLTCWDRDLGFVVLGALKMLL